MTLTELRAFVAQNYPLLRVKHCRDSHVIAYGALEIVEFRRAPEAAEARTAINAALRRQADLLAGMVRA
jgi:hypothetical protein